MAKSQLKKMCKNVRIARTAKVLKIVSGHVESGSLISITYYIIMRKPPVQKIAQLAQLAVVGRVRKDGMCSKSAQNAEKRRENLHI